MGLYLQLHTLHGLARGQHLELGRDEDTDGQILYVRYLALEFAKLAEVDRVDIMVRRIRDQAYPGYDQPLESLAPKVNIVRLNCGPDRYLRKVELWPYLSEYIDNCRDFIAHLGRTPDLLLSHYADAGYACARLSKELAIPQVHTGHELGKPKMARLGVDDDNFAAMDASYHFTERLKGEQYAIDNAAALVVSTDEERLFQYNMYDVDVADPRFCVIPPGANLDKFYPPGLGGRNEWDLLARERLLALLRHELAEPARPMIFTMSRLDYRKNLPSLIKAYAFDAELQEKANLVLVTGTLGQMGRHEQLLMEEIQGLITRHRLADKVCIIRHLTHKTEGGEIYRIVQESGGVFVNPSFQEDFGITVLEACASGVPVVATNKGGVVEILARCNCGELVEPRDTRQIAMACKKILTDKALWRRYSENGVNGVRQHYSWAVAARKELDLCQGILATWPGPVNPATGRQEQG